MKNIALLVILGSAMSLFAEDKVRDEQIEIVRLGLNVADDGPLAAAHPRIAKRLKLSDQQRQAIEPLFRELTSLRITSRNNAAKRRSLREEFPANGATQQEIREFSSESASVYRRLLQVEKDSPAAILAILTDDQRRQLTEFCPPKLEAELLDVETTQPRALRMDDPGRTLGVFDEDRITVFDLKTKKTLLTKTTPDEGNPERRRTWNESILALSGDGTRVACGWKVDGVPKPEIAVWKVADGSLESRYLWPGSPRMMWYAFSFNGAVTEVVGQAFEHKTQFFTVDRGKELRSFSLGDANLLQLSSDGKLLATGDWSTTTLWSMEDGKQLQRWSTPDGTWVRRPAFSSDGRQMVMPCHDYCTVVATDTGKTLATFAASGEKISSVAFANDDRWLVCATDSTVTVWDLEREVEIGIYSAKTSIYSAILVAAAAHSRAITASTVEGIYSLSLPDKAPSP